MVINYTNVALKWANKQLWGTIYFACDGTFFSKALVSYLDCFAKLFSPRRSIIKN